MTWRIEHGNALEVLRTLPTASIHTCCTSPPYWGLRDYGTASWVGGSTGCDHSTTRRDHNGEKQSTSAGTSRDSLAGLDACRKCGARRLDQQLGLERTPEEYVARLVEVFREVRRVLRDDATLWLNLGDSYNAYNGNAGPGSSFSAGAACDTQRPKLESGHGLRTKGLKPKDLVGIPWRVAFALQADGWYLRSDIIWAKPNPMPESVRDRPTKAHEYVFLLAKSERYFFDADAVREPASERPLSSWQSRKEAGEPIRRGDPGASGHVTRTATLASEPGRNVRSVWSVATQPFAEAHFATFPPALVERCIKAGCPVGGTVLDCFSGAGTSGLVADRLGRNFVGIELNRDYVAMAERRIFNDAPLLNAAQEQP